MKDPMAAATPRAPMPKRVPLQMPGAEKAHLLYFTRTSIST